MKTIGFQGGHLMAELGSKNDVMLFFNCVNKHVVSKDPSKWTLITERLYKHYVLMDDLDLSLALMREIKSTFALISFTSLDLDKLIEVETRINTKADYLDKVFSRYFIMFCDVVEAAKGFYDDWNIYKPVKIIVTDAPEYMNYKNLSLEEYDAVTGDPLWFR